MANLIFPQLSSGVVAQYPLRKRRVVQSSVNVFADGSMITSNINANSQHIWELAFSELTTNEQAAIQNLFSACQGPFRPFVFIDPTDNMLSYSTNLGLGNWISDPLLTLQSGLPDPMGGSSAFLLTNAAPVDQKIRQTVSAPANFHYCFSVYASSVSSSSLSLGRSAVSSQVETFSIDANWRRLVSAGRLNESQLSITASLIVPAGQTLAVFGPQLEPQLAPSRYRSTAVNGGIYQNAHFLGNTIAFQSDAAGLFSTLVSIETTT